MANVVTIGVIELLGSIDRNGLKLLDGLDNDPQSFSFGLYIEAGVVTIELDGNIHHIS